MKVEVLTLCDAATVDAAGKLNILGAFDRLNATAEPITHPHCALAVKLRFERIEEGHKKIRVTFVNADGAPVMPPIDGTADVRFQGPESSAAVQVAGAAGSRYCCCPKRAPGVGLEPTTPALTAPYSAN